MSEFTNLLNNLRSRFEDAGVPFAIGDAFALAAHGHPRFTRHLDVRVLSKALEPVHRALVGDRYSMFNEVTFQDAVSGLEIDIFPVEDEAQREAFDTAERIELYGAAPVRVLTPDGLALMLLREATEGDTDRRTERLRDIEILERKRGLDWAYLRAWSERTGYEAALEAVRAPDDGT